jgi:DNA mismatch endonuclease (patch repair protein)
MQSQRSWDTKPELALRSELHRLGLRYFVHRRPLPQLRREADVVFPQSKVAVFVNSCFWHGCAEHASWPRVNAEWWREKIEQNRTRDADTDRRLLEAGWLPLRIWEHDDPASAAKLVHEAVLGRRPKGRAPRAARDLEAAGLQIPFVGPARKTRDV